MLVVVFTYFYAYVVWQQQNIPENLQKQGAFIPGYRPGEPTSKYLMTYSTVSHWRVLSSWV